MIQHLFLTLTYNMSESPKLENEETLDNSEGVVTIEKLLVLNPEFV